MVEGKVLRRKKIEIAWSQSFSDDLKEFRQSGAGGRSQGRVMNAREESGRKVSR
jgi:hypothetical protein